MPAVLKNNKKTKKKKKEKNEIKIFENEQNE